MAKRIPNYVMQDKIGDVDSNRKPINPKGKKGSNAIEAQYRLIAKFMNIAKNSRRPTEPTLLEKLVAQGRQKRKNLKPLNPKTFAGGLNIADGITAALKTQNDLKLKKLINKFK